MPDTSQDHEAAQAVADAVGAFLNEMQAVTQWPVAIVLAGAHAQIVAMMTATLGGPITASACKQAASRIVDTPSLAACEVALAQPMGRA